MITMLQRSWLKVLLVLALVVGIFTLTPAFGGNDHRVVAYFSNGSGLYAGDEVRVLGVQVGKVTSVKPSGTQVRVELKVDDSVMIPSDAKAAIVAPSLVSGRFVQLAPVYTSGPTMADGASIPVARTAIPVSFDQLKQELTNLSTTLGPTATDKKGALNTAIDTVDANLGGGNAVRLRSSISAMRTAADSISASRGDLFGTIKNLQSFIHNLVVNDQAVQNFSGELGQFSNVLSVNKTQLATAVDTLDQALSLITTFVKTNQKNLTTSVKSLGTTAQTLASRSNELAGIFQVGPQAVDDLYFAFENQALTGRTSLSNSQGTAQLLCGAILGVGGTAKDCKTALGPLLGILKLSQLPGSPGVPQSAAAPSVTSSSRNAGAVDLANTVSGLVGLLTPGGQR